MAQAMGRGARSVVPSGVPAEDQLALLKVLARRMWRLLENRYPHAADALHDEMGCDCHALVDQAFEAAAILWERDRIYVEPCRRILDDQRRSSFRYLLRWRGGEDRVVAEAELIAMAGLEPEPEIVFEELDDVPM